ncbi:MAG TPA: hypothetical protein VMY35_10960 [Phycisphaerae bacterium]|nr:hypothetical protein [Phycisphaerae bacterium]
MIDPVAILAQSGMEEFAWKAFQIVLQSIISGVIVGLVAWGAMKANMANVKKRQEEMGEALEKLSGQITAARDERARCELTSSRTYAPREEIKGLLDRLDQIGVRIGERMEGIRTEFRNEVDRIHSRVTENAKRIERFRGDGEEA